ncbi:hypothetical protein [Paenibacillus mucilaginosus]|uniref:Uncharacterized protein n=1 Tax=Paenibacillus mucilaginosus (strain KNP414) TaxID=1036673 RepID=F8FLK4_PAEMK|nr:hypothetical protein [Paenibacillus mucilaginosus]AEI44131.1 hypothetical protein KNP414_05607 [Paenibacillus mucilaginosus KNP414]MCG7212397.1 hypothetical protein [Paenibacillus mucilaginosus]WDM25561.1 hypothetical protein KCX80_24320 [Paenibacillus mucilaginosus]
MHHAVPYFILSAADLLLLLWVWLRTRQSFMFILLLVYTGMVFTFEYVIMVLLGSYVYLPQVVPWRPYQDNVIGATISNVLTIPTLSVLIVMFRLRWLPVLGVTLAVCAVEWLFVRLGVYELRWWRIAYTLAALTFFFHLAKAWVDALERGFMDREKSKRLITFLSLLMAFFALAATMMFVFSLAGIRLFRAGVFPEPYHDDVVLATIDALTKACILAAVLYTTRRLLWRGLTLPLFAGLQLWLIHTDHLRIFLALPVYFALYLLCCLGVLALASQIDRRIQRYAGLD